MPFQSEKQRRYLWANEPEIARDWTDTYGSRIQKNDGGIMHHFQNYAQNDGNNVSVPRSFQARPQSEQVNLAYITPQEQQMLQALKPGTPHRGPMEIPNYDSFDAAGGYSNPDTGYSASSGGGGGGWQDSGRADAKKNEMAEQVRRNYVNKENIKSSPLYNRGLSFTGSGAGPKIGNWASGLAGSKVGGGLGGMLFGPLGMLLGSLFGQGVGRRAYKASQTDEKETAKDILLGQNTLLSNLFNKKKTPTNVGGEGLGGIDLSDMRDKFNQPLGDKPSEKMIVDGQLINRGDQSARARRLLTQRGIDWQLEPNDPNVPDEIEFFDGQQATGRAYDPYREMYDKDILDARQAEYDADLAQIGEGAGYIGPTQEELAAGVKLGDLTDDVWTGGKGLERMNQSEYENYLRGYR